MNSIDFSKYLYESEPGILRWKVERKKGTGKGYDAAMPGDIAGYLLKKFGRWRISIDGVKYYRSRIIWEMYNGMIPYKMQIDHINLNKLDDRIENLRLATNSENNRNTRLKSSNTSGFKGVYWSKEKKKWCARIRIGNNKRMNLGYFLKLEDASNAYNLASKEFHGEFSNV
jgi:hypothetical protein